MYTQNNSRYVCLALFFITMLVSSVFSAEDLCKLPKDAGRCRSLKPMFYFNMETKRCEGFLFKGCNGNANKFENLEECHEACQHHLVLVKLVVAVVVIVIVVATVEVVILPVFCPL